MDVQGKRSLSSLLADESDAPDGLETAQLRAATRSTLFGPEGVDVRVGRFILGPLIGEGAMGKVFRAHDPDLGRDVALKALEPVEGGDAAIEALLGEARTLARLNHPNVVTVHECGVDHGRVYIAMEYVERGTLGDWLRRNPPGTPGRFERALDLAAQAAAGIEAAHAVGLVHRDLKPNNMLVDDAERLRVADFGLARSLSHVSVEVTSSSEGSGDDGEHRTLAAWTRPAGTPGYVAPEQLGGNPSDASDQFSLCATLYEVFAGTKPFGGRTARERLESIRARRFEPPQASLPVPSWLRRVLERGLAEHAKDRFPSVGALLAAFERGRAGPARRRNALLGAVGATALAGALVLPGLLEDAPASVARPCADGAERFAQLWGPERAEATRDRVLRVDGAYSGQAWSSMAQSISTWGAQWTSEYEDACAATKVRGEQSPRGMELRMRCLDRQLLAVDATLERVGTTSLPAIVASLADGPRPLECRDIDQLEISLQEPIDPQSRAEIDAVLRAMQQGELALLDAKPQDGLDATAAAVERARALAHGPSLVEALVLHSRLLLANRKPFEAAAREAVQLAAKYGLPETETRAWLMVSRGADDHADIIKRDSDTSVALEAAKAALVRAGSSPQLAARVAQRRAEVAHMLHSDFERGAELYAEALALYRESPRPPLVEVGVLIDSYVAALASLSRHDEAVELSRWGLEYAAARRGTGHPETGHAHLRLARALMARGEHAQAQSEAEVALRILVEAGVPDHHLGSAHGLLGTMAIRQEDWATARVHAERKLEIYVEEYGWEGVTAAPLKLVGELELRSGSPEVAKAHLERALAMSTESFGPENPWMEGLREALGDACLALDEFDQASELFALVIPRLQTIHGAQTTFALPVMAKSVEAHLGRKDLDSARAQLEAIDAVLEGTRPPDVSLEAHVEVEIARAAFERETGAPRDARARIAALHATFPGWDGPIGERWTRAQLLRRVDTLRRKTL